MWSPPKPVPFTMSLYRLYPVLDLELTEKSTNTNTNTNTNTRKQLDDRIYPSCQGQSSANPNEHRSFLATVSSNASDGDLKVAFDKYLPLVEAQCMYRYYITHVLPPSLFGQPLDNYERNLDIDEDDVLGYCDCIKQLYCAVEDDNKDDFVKLINSMSPTELEDEMFILCLEMFSRDSAHCVRAILAGETKISFIVEWVSNSPLHEAASFVASDITALLLESGFSANASYKFDCPYSRDELPLGVALSNLRAWQFSFRTNSIPVWTIQFEDRSTKQQMIIDTIFRCEYKRRTSAVRLIIDLFRNSWRALRTVKLLAHSTRDVKHEFLNYLKEGNIVEVGALLLVARSRLLSSSTATGKYNFGFGSILEMHEFLLTAKKSLCIGANPSQPQKDKLIEMEETLLLLKIFDRIGDKLETLFRLKQASLTYHRYLAAASLIEDAGFDVKEEHLYVEKYNYPSNLRFRSYVLEKGVNDCKKTALTTYALPSWLKEAAFSGLADKTVSTSSPTYPFLAPIIPQMNCAPASNLASTSASLEIMPLHLLKKSSYVLGSLKWAFRRG